MNHDRCLDEQDARNAVINAAKAWLARPDVLREHNLAIAIARLTDIEACEDQEATG